ncbi:MAG: nitroreductase [Robiginitomaculum sp.]|nr:MAG: nitroreductase [Robiginitomaculum sp.]
MNTDVPQQNAPLEASAASQEVLSFLANRRSTLVKLMQAPGPDAQQLDMILRVAARVPDHRKLTPWRFLLFQDQARADFGVHLAEKFSEDCPNADTERVQFERDRFLRAPLVIGIVSSPKACPRGTPKWEQELSAGAVCMNMLLGARASGFAAQWLTEWYAFDPRIETVLGLGESERMAGFLYIGSCDAPLSERPRPDLSDLVAPWLYEKT